MKKMAIIAPSDFPIPAVCGGAVENLTSYFIFENEKNPVFRIDVYCAENKELNDFGFEYCNIIQLAPPRYKKIRQMYCAVFNRIAKRLKIQKAKFYFDKYMADSILYSNGYDLILIENNMNIFEHVFKQINGNEKIYFHLHNDVIESEYKNRRLCKLVYKNCEKIFCASRYLKERFELACGMDIHKKIRLLTNCIDFNNFHIFANEKINELRKRFDIEEDEYVILYSGRIAPEKGVLELVNAIVNLPEDMKVRCIVVGGSWFGTHSENGYLNQLKNKADGYKKRFIFTGYCSYKEMPLLYQMADITVVPSKWEEPFGMVALEALAMGCPLIITKKGGLKEIPDDKCAYFIEDMDNLTEMIGKMINKHYYCSEFQKQYMRRYAVEKVQKDFYGTEEYFNRLSEEVLDD